MFCKKCGTRLIDTDLYCNVCGEKIDRTVYCKVCGKPLREGSSFCSFCGSGVENNEKYEENEEYKENEEYAPEDDDIPISKLVQTRDFSFDMIEAKIVSDAVKELFVQENFEDLEGESKYANDYIDENGNDYEYENESNYEDDYVDDKESDYEDDYVDDKESNYENDYIDGYVNKTGREYIDTYDYKDNDGYIDENSDQYSDLYYDEDTDIYDDQYDFDKKGRLFPIIQIFKESRILMIITVTVFILLLIMIAAIYFGIKGNSNKNDQENQGNTVIENEEDQDVISDIPTAPKKMVLINTDVNVRDYPDTNQSTKLKVAKAGEKYEFIEYFDQNAEIKWVKIKLEDGTEGYVYGKYVTVEE